MYKKFSKSLSTAVALAILSINIATPLALTNEPTAANVKETTSATKKEPALPATENGDTTSTDKSSGCFKQLETYAKNRLTNFLLSYTITKLTYEFLKKPSILSQVHTAADKFRSDRKLAIALQCHINAFKSRNANVFEIDPSLIKKSHPKTLYLELRELNRLFDKYPDFTAALIKYKETTHSKFTLMPHGVKQRVEQCVKQCVKQCVEHYPTSELADAVTYSDLSGIAFGELGDYKDILCKHYPLHENNYFAPCDKDKIIECIAARAFGLVMVNLYVKLHDTHDMDSASREIQREILGHVMTKPGSYQCVGLISTYAKSSPFNLFADTFARMECFADTSKLCTRLQGYIDKFDNAVFKTYTTKARH